MKTVKNTAISAGQIPDPRQSVSRREILTGVIAFLGGAATLSACGEAVDPMTLHSGERRFFDAEQMRLLGRVVDIMIPATDTPGALLAGGDTFIDQMMATWASAETQSRYVAILKSIDDRASDSFGRVFADLSDEQQRQLLRDIDDTAFGPDPAVPGFRDLKYLVFAAYYSSEIGATVELQYVRVPGTGLRCVPIENIGRSWAHS